MFPELISLGPVGIKTYGCFMALGFLVGWKVVEYLCRRMGRAPEPLSNLLVALMILGVVGARAAYVIEHWASEFAAHPANVIRVDQGGLMFYGGFILAFSYFLFWCWRRHEKILPIADLFAAAIPLAHAFGRTGCFFYGCCYGRRSDACCAVSFPRGSPAWYEQLNANLLPSSATAALPVLPTQLMEAAALVAFFCVTMWLHRRFAATRAGVVTGVYLVGYAIIRFVMEFLRGDPRAEVGPLSIGQTISLGLLAAGILVIGVAFRQRKQ